MMKLNFVGWYDRHNCGDEAFKLVHRQLFPDAELSWLRDELEEFPATAEDIFILGGGDVLLDYYISRIPSNVPFFVYGVGLGGSDQLDTVRKYKERILGLWLRNKQDVETLLKENIDATYTPDLVFQIRNELLMDSGTDAETKQKKSLVFIPSNNFTQSALTNRNSRDLAYGLFFKHELASCLDYLAKYYDIIMLPMSFDDNDYDLGFITDVYSLMNMRSAVEIVHEELGPSKTAKIISKCDLTLSMKFHGLVFSMLSKVPFVNIGLTRKTELLCQESGLSQLSIPSYSFQRDRFLEVVKLAENNAVRQHISQQVDVCTALATDAGEGFVRKVKTYFNATKV